MIDPFLALAEAVVHDSVSGAPIEKISAYGYDEVARFAWIENEEGDRVTFVTDGFTVHRPAGTNSFGFFDFELNATTVMCGIREAGTDFTLGIWVMQAWGGERDEERSVLMLAVHVLDHDSESRDRHLFPIGMFTETPSDLSTFAQGIRSVLLGN